MHVHFDGGGAFNHIEELSSEGRLWGSAGERKARAYIGATGEEIGVRFKAEEAHFSRLICRGFGPVFSLLVAFLCAGGSFAYFFNGHAAIVFGALLLLVLNSIPYAALVFSRLGTSRGRDIAVNLAGRIESKRKLGTLLVCAHYDSKGQVIPLPLRIFLLLLSLTSAGALGTWYIVAGILSITGRDVLGKAVVVYLAFIPVVVLLALIGDRAGNSSPGALDNASGVAVVLELARIFKMYPLENLDVLAIAYGGEELGLCGSTNYVREHKTELREKQCYVLNFDMPFSRSGKISVNSGFGFPPKRTSAHLNDIAEAVAKDMGYELDRMFLFGGASDHYPWVKEDFEATSFISSAGFIHSARDTIDKIDREALRRVGEITLGVARKLDDGFSGQGAT